MVGAMAATQITIRSSRGPIEVGLRGPASTGADSTGPPYPRTTLGPVTEAREGAPAARVTYLGHSTVAIEAAGICLLTDPLLRGHLLGLLRRRSPLAPIRAAERPDAVLISHLHHDHLDLRSLRRLRVGTPIVAPAGSRRFLERRGFGEVSEISPGDSLPVGGLRVRAVPARHGRGGRPGTGRVDAIGYVVEAGARIYFAGDTELFEEMRAIDDALDLALLPVWGWGPRLGPGHLDPATAAESLRMLRPRFAVPIHWGTYTPVGAPRLWPWLTADVGDRFAHEAARLAPEVEVRVLKAGQSLVVSAGGRR
jgi:L-ascorbate metabolism protein UlaG (beta-lactamase superfamily)